MPLTDIWSDTFAGPEPGPRWVLGHLNESAELRLTLNNGIHWQFDQGHDYASAGLVLREPIDGDFEAELRFQVQHPQPGCTFELAAIAAAPPPEPAGASADARQVFNVHGAAPFVCSEFDEDDGWRLAYNPGISAGGRMPRNTYLRSRFAQPGGPVTGWLRLSRRDGRHWTSQGRLDTEPQWKLTGESLQLDFLQGPVHLRLVAKHWVKTAEKLTVAPANRVSMGFFTLRR